MLTIRKLRFSIELTSKNGGEQMYEFNVKRMKAERIAKGISISDMAKKIRNDTRNLFKKKKTGILELMLTI